MAAQVAGRLDAPGQVGLVPGDLPYPRRPAAAGPVRPGESTPLLARKAMTEATDPAESNDRADQAEPMENRERNDPTDPMDRAEPTDPMDRTEPLEPIDSTELSDQRDSTEPEGLGPHGLCAGMGRG